MGCVYVGSSFVRRSVPPCPSAQIRKRSCKRTGTVLFIYIYISEGLAKMTLTFFLTLSFLVSDANDIDTKEEGEEKDEDALSFPIHL